LSADLPTGKNREANVGAILGINLAHKLAGCRICISTQRLQQLSPAAFFEEPSRYRLSGTNGAQKVWQLKFWASFWLLQRKVQLRGQSMAT
jgi:hypothetical protein